MPVTWVAINNAIASLSLLIAGALWLRTVVSENPVADVPRWEVSADGEDLTLHVRVRNRGRHALYLHDLVFWSPPRDRIVAVRFVEATLREELLPRRSVGVILRDTRVCTQVTMEFEKKMEHAGEPWLTRKRDRPRCGARTRQGRPCQAPAVWDNEHDRPRNGRCRIHGGLSTGPKTAMGRRHSLEALFRGHANWLATANRDDVGDSASSERVARAQNREEG